MKKHVFRLLTLTLCACLVLGVTAHAAGKEPAVTRGQFIQQLYDVHKARNGNQGTVDAVAWASALGIVQGYTDGSIRTDSAITRTQMAVMLYRYANMTSLKSLIPPVMAQDILDGYTDAASVPAWADTQVKWAVSAKLWLSGSTDRLDPGAKVSRAECETALMAIYFGGTQLETDWDNYNTAADAKLTLDAYSDGKATFSVRNSGINWLNCEESCRLYRKVNGAWYLLDIYQMPRTTGAVVTPGTSVTWEQTYWNGLQIKLPAGEYRIAQTTQRGITPYSAVQYRTECRLSVDFAISET